MRDGWLSTPLSVDGRALWRVIDRFVGAVLSCAYRAEPEGAEAAEGVEGAEPGEAGKGGGAGGTPKPLVGEDASLREFWATARVAAMGEAMPLQLPALSFASLREYLVGTSATHTPRTVTHSHAQCTIPSLCALSLGALV